MIKRKTIFLIMFLIAINQLKAQNTLTGIVKDENEKAIFYATVVLYSQTDSSIVKSSLTDDNGKFKISGIKNGDYYLETRFLGYQNERLSHIKFPDANGSSVSVNMKTATEELSEVVVKAKKPLLEQQSDRLVVNVADNISSNNDNLMEVMKQVPGVIIMGDNISLAGSSNITILINGKTTKYMDVTSLLKDMPGDNIEKVEVIHQPGAEFDASGSGPIINIILKKNSLFGTFGTVKAGLTKGDAWRYNTNGSFTHFQGDVNISGSLGYRNSEYKSQMDIDRFVNNDLYSQVSKNSDFSESYRGNLAIDWYINQKHRIGVQSRLVNYDFEDQILNNTDIYYSDDAIEDLFLYTKNNRVGYWRLGSVNPYYTFDIDSTGHKLELDFNYIQFSSESTNLLDPESLNSDIVVSNQKTFQPGITKITVSKIDYTYPFTQYFKLQIGAKYSFADLDNDFQAEYFANNLWVNDESQSNHYLFTESILAGYGKLSYNKNKWSGTLGLRYEDSDSKGRSVGIDEVLSRRIKEFFPSASISRELIKDIKGIIAYSYRLDRPRYSSLNPFRYSLDLYTYDQGNPELEPEFTHSMKFSLAYQSQPFFNIEYKQTKDAMIQVAEQNDETGQAYRRMINLESKDEFNISLFFPLDFIPKISGYGGIMVNNKYFNTPYLDEIYEVSKWDYVAFLQMRFTLPWDILTELSGYYTSGGIDGTITYEYMYGSSIGFSKKFLDNRFQINFGINNMFTRFFHGEIKYSNLDIKMYNSWESPVYSLRLSYSFGNKHLTREKHKTGATEELNRTGKH